jgi:CubicO group peptidase (beta-lactamase class C family)
VAASLEPHAASPRGQGRLYGYGWWLRELGGVRVPVAWGFGGQLILVIEELDLVVVATSASTPGPDRRRHTRALYDLLEEQILLPLAIES